MKSKLCKYSIKSDDGRHKFLLCGKCEQVCGFFRWCNNEMYFKMADKYYKKCKLY